MGNKADKHTNSRPQTLLKTTRMLHSQASEPSTSEQLNFTETEASDFQAFFAQCNTKHAIDKQAYFQDVIESCPRIKQLFSDISELTGDHRCEYLHSRNFDEVLTFTMKNLLKPETLGAFYEQLGARHSELREDGFTATLWDDMASHLKTQITLINDDDQTINESINHRFIKLILCGSYQARIDREQAVLKKFEM